MITADQLHDLAMDRADDADRSRRRDQPKLARECYADAFEMELLSAQHTTGFFRAVFYRSAAWLAYNAGMYTEAVEAAKTGLQCDPHPKIRDELKEVLQEAMNDQLMQAINDLKSVCEIERDEHGRIILIEFPPDMGNGFNVRFDANNPEGSPMTLKRLFETAEQMSPPAEIRVDSVPTEELDALHQAYNESMANLTTPKQQLVTIEDDGNGGMKFTQSDVPVITVQRNRPGEAHALFTNKMVYHGKFMVIVED